MQISPRWARNLSPEQQQSKKAVPQQVRICLTWSSQRFSNDDSEKFHASWVFLPGEYEKANRKSTETDLYRNSFGAAKARHFIFAYTNKIQSINRHFELPSETNTFSLKYVITLALRPQCYLPCKMKTEPDTNTASPWNFRTTVLRQANWQNRDKNKQTNKKPAIMFSFPEKSGKKIRKERKKTGSTIQAVDTFVSETYLVTEVF